MQSYSKNGWIQCAKMFGEKLNNNLDLSPVCKFFLFVLFHEGRAVESSRHRDLVSGCCLGFQNPTPTPNAPMDMFTRVVIYRENNSPRTELEEWFRNDHQWPKMCLFSILSLYCIVISRDPPSKWSKIYGLLKSTTSDHPFIYYVYIIQLIYIETIYIIYISSLHIIFHTKNKTSFSFWTKFKDL